MSATGLQGWPSVVLAGFARIQPMVTRIRSPKPVRHFIREWREAKGKSQQQVADLLDTAKGQISRWENSKRGVNVEVLAALAYALGIEPEDFYRHPNQPSADELLRNASPHVREQAVALVRTLLRTGTDMQLLPIDDDDADEIPSSPVGRTSQEHRARRK